MNILALNSGSSSLKFKLVEIDDRAGLPARGVAEGLIEEIGPDARLVFDRGGRRLQAETRSIATHEEAVRWMLEVLERRSVGEGRAWQVGAIGHRVVHGGERFQEPVVIDDEVLAEIDRLIELAPLHNPGCLAGIRGARLAFGAEIPMVAVFDTGFHRSLPPRSATYAIDLNLAKNHGIRRYGFHGIAHASLATTCAATMARPLDELRLITLQLGNGCSAAAIDRGRSVDTSMGFTPLEGLVMGTRSGDLDPALIGYLVRREGLSVEAVERVLNERSGLLGLSGLTRDMRELLQVAERDPASRSALALEVFCYRVKKYIGAYLAVLGGADAVVFGGGIGEHAPAIRARICEGMDWCGLRLDRASNDAAVHVVPGSAVPIGDAGAPVACFVAGVDEEIEIARATAACWQSGVS